MTTSPALTFYSLLQARGVGARAAEALNVGIVLHLSDGPMVAITQNATRLRSLHPDFSAVKLANWAGEVESALREHAYTVTDVAQRHAMLSLFVQPFTVSPEMAQVSIQTEPAATMKELMAWLVDAPVRRLKPAVKPRKRNTRLVHELTAWFRSAKVYSTRIEDLSNGKVVSAYPIDPAAELYADFAVLNGQLHAIETLDLRGVDHLTPTMRGDAAIKRTTLDEARDKVDGKRMVILSASDYAVARPAIQMVSRYADQVFDMNLPADRQSLADFIGNALHKQALPALDLHS